MKCEWQRKLVLEKHRGGHCIAPSGGVCGCGTREPASVKYRRRIARRLLAKQLRKELSVV